MTRFGKLKFIRDLGRINGVRFWELECDCGVVKTINADNVKRGLVKSCGCLQLASRTKHGDAPARGKSPEYCAYTNMLQRCLNPKHPEYKNYGARGITVCDRWRESYADFLKDVGRRPSSSHSIDRYENNGNYEIDNVHWGTKAEQSLNRRVTRFVEIGGERLCLAEWAQRIGIKKHTLYTHIANGRDPAEYIAMRLRTLGLAEDGRTFEQVTADRQGSKA